jgi:putative ABC transport system ATP-binding protein
VIRLQDVRKTYQLGGRSIEALRGATLEIAESGFYAVMGPSGSGKSTLLHLMAALDRPDSGTIEVAGQRLDQLNEAELTDFRRRRVGLVFQQFNLLSTLTALENVALPGMLDGMSRAEQMRRAGSLLAALGLAARADHRPDALSGGEQQRVAIARALLFEPPVLMADEPTGNLDSNTSRALWELLRNITAERSMTLVMVTHEPAAAVHCDRVFLLRDGVVRGSFEVDGLDAAELATRAHRDLG